MSSFLTDQDGHPLVRHVTGASSSSSSSGSSTASGPSLRTVSQSNRFTGQPSSQTSDSRSRHGTSVSRSLGGLTNGSTSYSSGASVSYTAARFPASAVAAIDRYGVLIPRPVPEIKKYECPFDRLICLLTYTTYQEWYDHSLTHFETHGPPAKASCCFCDKKFEKAKPKQTWEARMKHVQSHHDDGEQLRTSRYDPELYRYLWNKKIINDLTYRDLGQDTSSNTAGPSTSVHGRGSRR